MGSHSNKKIPAIPRLEKWIYVTGIDSCRTGDMFGKQENRVSDAERVLGGFQVKSQDRKCRRLGKMLLDRKTSSLPEVEPFRE